MNGGINMFRESSLNEIVNLLPKGLEELKKLIENFSKDVYFEVGTNLKSAVIDEVDFAGKQFAIVLDFEKNKIEFIDDIVNPDYYNIRNEWDEILLPIKEFSKKKGFTFAVDNVGNEDYLWATLSGKMSEFDEGFLEEVMQSWDNINKTIRGK